MANVAFLVGTQEQYDRSAKDQYTLYWVYDTKRLYKGPVLYGTGAEATQAAAGLLSAEDKALLDELASGKAKFLTKEEAEKTYQSIEAANKMREELERSISSISAAIDDPKFVLYSAEGTFGVMATNGGHNDLRIFAPLGCLTGEEQSIPDMNPDYFYLTFRAYTNEAVSDTVAWTLWGFEEYMTGIGAVQVDENNRRYYEVYFPIAKKVEDGWAMLGENNDWDAGRIAGYNFYINFTKDDVTQVSLSRRITLVDDEGDYRRNEDPFVPELWWKAEGAEKKADNAVSAVTWRPISDRP